MWAERRNITRWAAEAGESDGGVCSLGSRGRGEESGRGAYALSSIAEAGERRAAEVRAR